MMQARGVSAPILRARAAFGQSGPAEARTLLVSQDGGSSEGLNRREHGERSELHFVSYHDGHEGSALHSFVSFVSFVVNP
jgi:hypothetical protein